MRARLLPVRQSKTFFLFYTFLHYVTCPMHKKQKHLPIIKAAAHLGVSRQTIYNMIRRGDLKSVRIGRKLTVLKRQLDSFVIT